MAAQSHRSPEQQHEAMYEAMLQSPARSQSTPLGNRPEVHDPSDQDSKRLKAEVDEMRRFMQNQQDQLLVAIRTATAAALAATEASKAIARFGDDGARQSVLALTSATAGPQAPVEQESTRYAGGAETTAQSHHAPPVSAVPATRTDRLPPVIGEAIERVKKEFTKDVRKFLKAKQKANRSSEELASFDDAKMLLPKGIKPFTSVTTLTELDEMMDGTKTQQLVLAINIPQGTTRRRALEMVYYQSSKFAKQVDNEALREKAKNAEIKARKQTFLEASLAAARESVTHSNIEGLELPKQKEINDQKFVEKVEITYEEVYKGIEKELKIEQEKAMVDKNKTDEMSKELCKANPEQLFKEVVTEIVDQRMKMEDVGNKEEANKGIPWLIESLREKQKNGKSPGGSRGQKGQKTPKDNSMGKGKGQQSQTNKTKGKGKGKLQVKGKGKGKTKGKQKSTKSQEMPKGKGKGKPHKGKGKTSGKGKEKPKGKNKGKHRV